MDVFAVEAFAASWIEIEPNLRKLSSSTSSKPLRLRGLKYNLCEEKVIVYLSKPLRLRGLK